MWKLPIPIVITYFNKATVEYAKIHQKKTLGSISIGRKQGKILTNKILSDLSLLALTFKSSTPSTTCSLQSATLWPKRFFTVSSSLKEEMSIWSRLIRFMASSSLQEIRDIWTDFICLTNKLNKMSKAFTCHHQHNSVSISDICNCSHLLTWQHVEPPLLSNSRTTESIPPWTYNSCVLLWGPLLRYYVLILGHWQSSYAMHRLGS